MCYWQIFKHVTCLRQMTLSCILLGVCDIPDIFSDLSCDPPTLSWACTGHHELWRDQGTARANHVVPAWSIIEEERCRKHLHQKSWQVHWQQGSVWHVLCFWKHPLLQGIESETIVIFFFFFGSPTKNKHGFDLGLFFYSACPTLYRTCCSFDTFP